MVKVSQNIYCVKKDLFECFKNRRAQDDDNETGLKEGRGIEIKKLQCFHSHAAPSA